MAYEPIALFCRFDQGQTRVKACQLILLAITLLLMFMPATEYFWTSDRFLRGGHDLEFTLLGILIFFGLVALIANQTILLPLFSLVTVFHLKALKVHRLFSLTIGRIVGTQANLSHRNRLSDLLASNRAAPLRI